MLLQFRRVLAERCCWSGQDLGYPAVSARQAPKSRPFQHVAFILGPARQRHPVRLQAYPAQPGQSTCSSPSAPAKLYDVVALGNLCVDVVTPILDKLPPLDVIKSRKMLDQLTQQATDSSLWEVGANCNVLIAAARLGLRPACIGNLGKDAYGQFLLDALKAEGIKSVEPLAPGAFQEELKHTLVCFVLVDKSASHGFCSRYDFGPWPLLPGVNSLTPTATQMLQNTRVMLINGFLFDELPAHVVLAACKTARASGAAVFFDPGPRAWTLPHGVLQAVLDVADVVIATQEEAQVMTGEGDPEAAGWHIVGRPGAATHWCFIKMGPSGALLCSKELASGHWQPALQVDVADTVGCGDSFAAACVLGYIRGAPPQPMLALANAVGAATATGTGAGRNVATADAVLDLLATAQPKQAAISISTEDIAPDRAASSTASASGQQAELAEARHPTHRVAGTARTHAIQNHRDSLVNQEQLAAGAQAGSNKVLPDTRLQQLSVRLWHTEPPQQLREAATDLLLANLRRTE